MWGKFANEPGDQVFQASAARPVSLDAFVTHNVAYRNNCKAVLCCAVWHEPSCRDQDDRAATLSDLVPRWPLLAPDPQLHSTLTLPL